MDDFVIPVKTMEKLNEQTVRFLKIAEKYNLCFKWLKYNFNMEENTHSRNYSGKETSQNKAEEDQGSKKMEDANEGQGRREFPWIC